MVEVGFKRVLVLRTFELSLVVEVELGRVDVPVLEGELGRVDVLVIVLVLVLKVVVLEVVEEEVGQGNTSMI